METSSWHRSTAVHYHQQDNVWYCGKAVAQMMLAALLGETLPQGTIGTPQMSPRALSAALNHHLMVWGAPQRFHAVCDADLKRGIERIADTISRTGIGVPVSVARGGHWVVVSGAMIDEANRVRGFFIDDSAPSGGNQIHGSCDLCGLGDKHGTANVYVTPLGWERYYWYKRESFGPHKGYVTIVPRSRSGTQDWVLQSKADAGGITTLGNADAVQIVNEELDAQHLRREGPLAKLLKNVIVMPRYGRPFLSLVRQGIETNRFKLEAEQSRYWTELFENGVMVGRASVDPDEGRMLGVEIPISLTFMPHAAEAQARYALSRFSHLIGGCVDCRAIENANFSVCSRQSTPHVSPGTLFRIDLDHETVIYLGERQARNRW
jgi:hypothetical protein